MSLVSKIFVFFIFLVALPFSYMAARTLKIHSIWRPEQAELKKKIADEEAKQLALAEGIKQEADGTTVVLDELNKEKLAVELGEVLFLRGRVWRRCIVNEVDDQGKVTLTIEFPRPHALQPTDVGKLMLYAFDQKVSKIGAGGVREEAPEVPAAEPEDAAPEDAAPEDAAPDDTAPEEDAAPDDAPAEDAAPVDEGAGVSEYDAADGLCQEAPMEEAPADGDAAGEGGAEEGEGEGEGGEEEPEEEEEPAIEQAEDDSHLEYEIDRYMGAFRLTGIDRYKITLELAEQPTADRIQKLKNSSKTWILFDTMPIDDPDAFSIWDDETKAKKLPPSAREELAARGQELKDGETAESFWVEVEFLRSHRVELSILVDEEREALAALAKSQREAAMHALGMSEDDIQDELEKMDIQIAGLGTVLDPTWEKPKAEDGDARPGVDQRPLGNPGTKRAESISVTFSRGDRAMFYPKTAAELTGDNFGLPLKRNGEAEPDEAEGEAPKADDAPAAGAQPVAKVIRRVRLWSPRNYLGIFAFNSQRVATLVNQIAESQNENDRLFLLDPEVEVDPDDPYKSVIGGALFEKRLLMAAKKAERDRYLADLEQFTYDYKAVDNYYKKVVAQHAQILAEREQLLAQVDALAKQLALLKRQQRDRIEQRAAATASAAKP